MMRPGRRVYTLYIEHVNDPVCGALGTRQDRRSGRKAVAICSSFIIFRFNHDEQRVTRGFGMFRKLVRKAVFALAGVACGAGLLLAASGAGQAEERVFVTIDQAKIMKLGGDASTIILGNPAIADATVFNKSMLVITGKSFGTTNLVVLDANGDEIASNLVTVRADDGRMVTVHKGTARESFDCAPTCQPSMALGDVSTSFEQLNSQISSRIAISESNGQ